jgi:hypothetical protein
MRRTKEISSLLLVVILLAGLAVEGTCGSTDGPFYYNIRSLGMGGAGVATGKGVEAMVYNPALLAQVPFDLALPRIRIEFTDDLFEIIKFATDHQDDFANYKSLPPDAGKKFLDDMAPFDDKWVRFNLAPAVGLSLQRIAVLGYNNTRGGIRLDKGIYTPRTYAEGVMDNVVTGGISLPAMPGLDVGLGIKYIDRRESGLVKLSASSLGGNKKIIQDVIDKISESKTGYGVDVGGIYKLTESIQLGFVMQDLLGKVGDDDLRLNVRAGACWHPVRGLTLAADIVDLLNRGSDAALKKVHLGAEVDVPVLKLRVGINQGYPTIGVGLNLLILQIEYAYYGYETGISPGDLPEWRHALQIGLGF